MKFYEDTVLQARKHEHLVPGDYYLCERKPDATTVLLLDGVGSGVYANIAAIACGSRLMELMDGGRSLQAACGHVAESMHRARTEEIPFAAFVALRILPSGQFTCYAYENPGPILIHDHNATACPQRFIALKYEMIAESTGTLSAGDRLLLMSDGVTHAGMGGGYATGWGTEGVVGETNAYLRAGRDALKLPAHLLHTAYTLSGKVYWDDTSLAMVTCRPAQALTLLTGPPASRADDGRAVRLFMEAPGKKVICGSTTTEIASRELKRPTSIASMDISPGSPPEYKMEGIDLITEGAVTLNQAMNLLEEADEIDFSQSDSPVFKLCQLLLEADAIAFLVGGGYNQGHDDPLFQQLGVKPRRRVVRRMAEFLKAKGKEVSVRRL
jgi:hypothetical protein